MLGAFILLLGATYGGVAFYYSNKFWKGTEINGIDVGKLTEKEGEDLIAEQASGYSITLEFRENQIENISGTSIGYQYVPDGSINEILRNQKSIKWIIGYLKKSTYRIANNIEFDEEELRAHLNGLPCILSENQQAPQDAYITFQGAVSR